MKLGVTLPYAEGEMTRAQMVEFVQAADRLGYDTVWVPEAWTYDAFMLLASVAELTEHIKLGTSIVNVYSRTPALIGQSTATLDMLSGGRAVLGIGASGPQVIEGWHGMPYRKPLQRTRETIDIVRMILRRDRLNYDGDVFQLGMGLKLINHPLRPDVPIYVASLGPKNVAMTAELADGWIPVLFSPTRWREVFGDALDEGLAKRSADLPPLQITPSVSIGITDAPQAAATIARFGLALYIGGMGSREHNFYNEVARRYGYVDEAAEIQDLFLGGDKGAAAERVTDAMVDEFSVIGPEGLVKEKLSAFKESGASALLVNVIAMSQRQRLEALEKIIGLV
ncbi:MAG TPA: LLM class F420-dependent oxidoreductase [Egibacteraceae bacterium]|nr:LLM class F420-dependent oxidoreductase [Egibacteraceae bacterium]